MFLKKIEKAGHGPVPCPDPPATRSMGREVDVRKEIHGRPPHHISHRRKRHNRKNLHSEGNKDKDTRRADSRLPEEVKYTTAVRRAGVSPALPASIFVARTRSPATSSVESSP